MLRWIAGVAVALACAAPCAAPPTVLPGWPVRAAPGPGAPGAGGRARSSSTTGLVDAFRYTVAAYRLDGRRRWVNARTAGCGNCDEGTQPVRRQADGTFGPIGVIGDDYWAVDQAGREVRGCAGVVLPDGTCIAVESRLLGGTVAENALVARRGGVALWSLAEPDLDWIPEFDVAPMTVRDGGGTAYTAYGQFTPQARDVAVDSATGALRARVPGTVDFVGATADAGLAVQGSQLVAIGADGARRWSSTAVRARLLQPETSSWTARARGSTSATRPATGSGRRPWTRTPGRVLWRSPANQRVTPLSLAQGGLLLAGVEQGSSRSLRALGGADGRARWTFRTSGRWSAPAS